MRRIALLGPVALALAVSSFIGASAKGKPIFAPGGATGFSTTAGTLCPFAVEADVLVDRSTQKIFLDANGDPDHILVSGFVATRFTNTDTGKSIVRNASGPSRIDFDDDGSVTVTGRGPGWVARFATDEGGPSLMYFLGRISLRVSDRGRISDLTHVGTQQDLCAILA